MVIVVVALVPQAAIPPQTNVNGSPFSAACQIATWQLTDEDGAVDVL